MWVQVKLLKNLIWNHKKKENDHATLCLFLFISLSWQGINNNIAKFHREGGTTIKL